jgi:hypothetical protein
MIRFTALPVVFIALAALTAIADESNHGGELSEQQLGAVHFPISCASSVQRSFERGVALLHSFAFETAEATFRQVAKEDPRCAMAHWGIAKTFSRWGRPDSNQLKRGWEEVQVAKSLHAKTARERAYIAAEAAFYEHPDRGDEKRDEKYLGVMALVSAVPRRSGGSGILCICFKEFR